MAKEYIEKAAFREVLRKSHEYHASNCRESVLLDRDIRLLNEQPAADVVEVVRCAQCKHFNVITEDGRIKIGCSKHEIVTFKNDFCSYGEKRDSE